MLVTVTPLLCVMFLKKSGKSDDAAGNGTGGGGFYGLYWRLLQSAMETTRGS